MGSPFRSVTEHTTWGDVHIFLLETLSRVFVGFKPSLALSLGNVGSASLHSTTKTR